jgi:hypothetical protein
MAGSGSRARAARAFALSALVMMALTWSATAQGRGAARLSFVGASGEAIHVGMKPSSSGAWTGTLNILVRNRSSSSGRLRLRFFPRSSAHAINLGAVEQSRGLAWRVRPPAKQLRLHRRELEHVRLAFLLPKGMPLSALDGLLVAQLRLARREQRDVAPAQARIKAVPKVPADVSFDPTRLTLNVVRGCDLLLTKPCGTTATVTLRGDGAHLLERAYQLARAGQRCEDARPWHSSCCRTGPADRCRCG